MFFCFVFFLIPASVAEAAAVIPNGAKIFLANWTATFINVPANLLNSEPKNPPNRTILDISTLDNFISVDRLFSNIFLNFVFCLVFNNN